MISNENLTKLSYEMSNAFEEINQEYITKMCEHIKSIGELTATDAHILEQLDLMNANIKEINLAIRKQCGISAKQLNAIYQKCGEETYRDLSIYYKYRQIKQVPFSQNVRMQSMVKSVSELTGNAFKNLSKTTVSSKLYKKAVDKAVYAVTSGVTDYKTFMRRTIVKASREGLKVRYASGLERRLDSAVRMNILDGARQVAQGVRMIGGEQFNADGVEIDAHDLCAEDHIDIQGQQMTMEEYEERVENDPDVRPIGELNCQHSMTPIIIGVSTKTYSDEDLEELKEHSRELIDFNGREISRYDASQVMRQIETNVRKQKDILIGAKAMNDTTQVARTKERIDILQNKYSQITKSANLKPRTYRMSVPSRSQKYRNSAIKEYTKKL